MAIETYQAKRANELGLPEGAGKRYSLEDLTSFQDRTFEGGCFKGEALGEGAQQNPVNSHLLIIQAALTIPMASILVYDWWAQNFG